MRWIILRRDMRAPGFRATVLRIIRVNGARAPDGDAGALRDAGNAPPTGRGQPASGEKNWADDMPEPFRFRPVTPPDGRRTSSSQSSSSQRERPALRTPAGRLLFAIVLLLGLAAAAGGAWLAAGRPVPEALRMDLPLRFEDISPQSFAVLFLAALIVLGAAAALILTGQALRRAFNPDYSAPYRTYILFTLTAAMISGYATTYGVIIEFLDPSQGFIRYRIFPVIVFLYCFLFVFLTWSWTFDLVIRSEPRRRALIAILIPLLAAIPLFAVSTTTSALGLAGPRILERKVLTWLDDYSAALSDLSVYVGETESAALSMETFAGRLTQLSAQEAETGAITGFAGRGAIVAQLNVAADDLRAGADLIRRERAQREAAIGSMGDEIEATRLEILGGAFFETAEGAPLPVRDWQDKVQARDRSLRRRWDETASRAYVQAAIGQLQLVDSLIMRGGVSDRSAIAAAQRSAQEQISAYLGTGREIVRADLAEAAVKPPPAPPVAAYQSPLVVLFTSWKQAILPWAIAIAVDFGPWVWIALAAIAGYDRRRSRARYAAPEGHHWRDDEGWSPQGRTPVSGGAAASPHLIEARPMPKLDQR